MLKKLESSTAINKCKKTFSQFGTPKELVTGNGHEFTIHDLRLFLRTWDFQHRTIRLHFHQSNVLVERGIQTVKSTLKIIKLANKVHYLSILFLNSQPGKNRLSPAHQLFRSAVLEPLLNHNLNPLPPKQKLNQKPRIDYQP